VITKQTSLSTMKQLRQNFAGRIHFRKVSHISKRVMDLHDQKNIVDFKIINIDFHAYNTPILFTI